MKTARVTVVFSSGNCMIWDEAESLSKMFRQDKDNPVKLEHNDTVNYEEEEGTGRVINVKKIDPVSS